jgi:hypothetical protein
MQYYKYILRNVAKRHNKTRAHRFHTSALYYLSYKSGRFLLVQ